MRRSVSPFCLPLAIDREEAGGCRAPCSSLDGRHRASGLAFDDLQLGVGHLGR